MEINGTLKLEYWIINKATNKYYERREIELDEESVLTGVRDRLSVPINCDMENKFYFGDFSIIID
jgi:hypothetical protein